MNKTLATLACVSVLFTACAHRESASDTSASTATGAATTKRMTISGAKADAFLKIMVNAGVTNPPTPVPVLGSANLAADMIQCSAAVVPNPVPSCKITFYNGTKSASAQSTADAAAMHQMLIDNGAQLGFQDVGVGATVTRATNVLCSRPVVPNPVTSCSFDVKVAAPATRKVTLSGDDGDAFMKILIAAGVVNPPTPVPVLGSHNVSAQNIQCSVPVVPNAKASCAFTYYNGTKTASAQTDADAATMHRLLIANGGQLSWRDVGVGATVTRATNVFCGRPVVPNAKATCSFEVKN